MAVRKSTRKKATAKKALAKKMAPASCAGCPNRKTQQGVIHDLIEHLGSKLTTEDGKASVGDYIRLLQLRKEIEGEQPREIKVTWIAPTEKESKSVE